MYEQANERINEGLSFGARLMLGVVAALFGIIMFLIANPEHREGFYAFGAFCMLIAIACFTKGRVRQFIGSLVGSTIFLVGVWYLAVELREGNLWSGVSSAFNATRYLLFIGIPGAAYAYKTRFGFHRAP